MSVQPACDRSISIGVVIRRTPGVTRWAKWAWRACAVLPGAGPAHWRELRRDGDCVEYHAATATLKLFAAETEAYLHGLQARDPSLFVIMRKCGGPFPLKVDLITASPYEAQDYSDNGDDIVEKVSMPPGLVAWVQSFVDEAHKEEEFIKRRRDKERIDRVQDGVGDPRIGTLADVYASPALKRMRRA